MTDDEEKKKPASSTAAAAAEQKNAGASAAADDDSAKNGEAAPSSPQPPQDGSKVVAQANQGGSFSTMSSSSLKFVLLVLMVLQNSVTVLIGRHTRSSVANTNELYVVNHLIISVEVGKLLLALTFEYFHTGGHLLKSLRENVLDRPVDALKIVIPSLLYLVQNSLLYVALSNLSAPLFQVTYQCKLLTTALVSVVMLQRRYSLKQWVCLTLLGIGVAIVVLGESSAASGAKNAAETTEVKATASDVNDDDAGDATSTGQDSASTTALPAQSLFVGLVAVTIACMSSALAGVYFEKVLKKSTTDGTAGGIARPPVSMWMRNVQMAFFSVCIGLLQYVNLGPDDAAKPFGHGFTNWVWILIGLQAGGGMLVAAVIKYADNVLKGLATGVSVVVASLASVVLFGTHVSGQFACGAAVILGSVFFFSNDMPGGGGKRKVEKGGPGDRGGGGKKVEMKSLLPK